MQNILRNSLKPFGPARERCIEMLEDLGIVVTACNPSVGHWRSSPFADVYRWEFSGTYNGMSVTGGCWETMSKCAKAERLEWDRKDDEVWPVGTRTRKRKHK